MSRSSFLAATLAASIFASPAIAGEAPILGHDLLGSGQEKVLVFHDWMGEMQNYDTVRPWLDTETFTYIFVDIRGYGRSKSLTGHYNSDEIATDTFKLADYLGLEKFHIVGHSMTGMAGFKTVMKDWKAEQRIKSYVAITPVTPDGYPASKDDKAFLEAAISDNDTAQNAFAGLTGGKLNTAWGKAKTVRNRATSRPVVLRGYFNMWLEEDFSKDLESAKVGTPTLVIGGRNDLPGFQEEYYSKTLAKWMPNIKFSYFDNAGHYPMQETPILFASKVEEHLKANK